MNNYGHTERITNVYCELELQKKKVALYTTVLPLMPLLYDSKIINWTNPLKKRLETPELMWMW